MTTGIRVAMSREPEVRDKATAAGKSLMGLLQARLSSLHAAADMRLTGPQEIFPMLAAAGIRGAG